jgi:flagellin FlaB
MVSSDGTFDIVSYTATTEGGGTTGDAAFVTNTFQDDDNSISNSNVLNDPADRANMKLQTDSVPASAEDSDLSGNLVGASLSEGSTASIKLNTQAGGETTATLVVPESLSGKSAVSL